MNETGLQIYELCRRLFPICRSITGDGVRETLRILQEILPALQTFEVPSGEKCFDWIVPLEWNIRDAFIIAPNGEKIVDFHKSNLHVVGYSTPIDQKMSLEELQKRLHSLPAQPDAIPYITSYYKETWGFCLSENQRRNLRPGEYRVFIDSELKQGSLSYGELILKGETEQEIFLSTYICHPSMANNEVSGPSVTAFLAKYLQEKAHRKYTYRIIFIPETIGSIVYLSRNLEVMKKNIAAGFNITCIGDERAYSFLPSRAGNTLADKVALHVLRNLQPDFVHYDFLQRGSDERQYCSPKIDLPVVSIMRTKYGEYPEYHTSLDNLDFISPAGLFGGYEILRNCLECLENNEYPEVTVFGEPQLGKRGLYPPLSTKESRAQVLTMLNLIAYSDGKTSLLEIAEQIRVPMWELIPLTARLKEESLLVSRAPETITKN